jgi:hypothetical protein
MTLHGALIVALTAAAQLSSVAGGLNFISAPPAAADPGITVEHLFLSTERQVI